MTTELPSLSNLQSDPGEDGSGGISFMIPSMLIVILASLWPAGQWLMVKTGISWGGLFEKNPLDRWDLNG